MAGPLKRLELENGHTVHHLADSGSVLPELFEGNVRIDCLKKAGRPAKLRASEGWESGLIRRS